MLKRLIPAPFRPAARRAYNTILDGIDGLAGRRDALTPPRNLLFVGRGDFKAIGREFLTYFVELGGLKPDHRVLDVGSGIGRMAVPLTGYLSPQGQYRGIEIVEEGTRWCRETITPRFPNFQFLRADVYNKLYHPKGRYQAKEYRFPFEDASFDFVFLTSVFTHMFPADTANYLSEVSRVLHPAGRCLATFFLLNDESHPLVARGASTLPFTVEGSDYRTISAEIPEEAIALEEQFVRELYQSNRLSMLEPIHYGSWCGRTAYLSYQDIVMSEKMSRAGS